MWSWALKGVADEEFQGLEGMARSTPAYVRELPCNRQFSEARNIRIDFPNTQVCCLGGGQHCGRMRKAWKAELQRFLNIATGSASELEYHFLLARDLGYIDELAHKSVNTATVDVKKMLAALVRKVDSDRLTG